MFSLADDRVEAMVSEYLMYPPVVRFDFLTRIVNRVTGSRRRSRRRTSSAPSSSA